jgi:transposase
MHRLQELVRLFRLGCKAKEVARLLKMSPNTERKYREALQANGLLCGSPDLLPDLEVLQTVVNVALPPKQPPQYVSTVEKWAERIEKMVEGGATPTAIYDRLRLEEKDFKGSLSAVKRICGRIKRVKGVKAEDVAIPVETAAGHVAQVDFGYAGKLYDPEEKRLRKAWVFVMVLGFSRHMFARIVFDQKVETWIRLHIEAFAKLGGVVEVVVPDNLKSAVVRAAFGTSGPTTLNRSYRELARHYGFKVDPTPPRSPDKKGKVESGVKYVKNNFFRSRKDILDAGDLQRQLDLWVAEIAGLRRHGTIHQRPLELFEQVERDALQPLPDKPYAMIIWREPKVHQDTHILFEKGLYSVPWKLIGRKVMARGTPSSVEVYSNDVRVATHDRVPPGQRSTKEEHLPPHRRDLRHRSRSYWEARADAMGREVRQYIQEVFDSDDVLYQLRTVQQIVTLLEQYPRQRAEAACTRASYFANYTYGGVKRILTRALDQQPFLPVVQLERGGLENPRFTRTIQELLPLPMEETDAPN